MLEAAEKTAGRSFLRLGFIVSQSVIVSRTACLFCGAECVVCVVVVGVIIIIIIIIIVIIIIIITNIITILYIITILFSAQYPEKGYYKG